MHPANQRNKLIIITAWVGIELRAKEPGLWTGGIDACTPTQNYVSQYAEIEVVDAPVAPEIAE